MAPPCIGMGEAVQVERGAERDALHQKRRKTGESLHQPLFCVRNGRLVLVRCRVASSVGALAWPRRVLAWARRCKRSGARNVMHCIKNEEKQVIQPIVQLLTLLTFAPCTGSAGHIYIVLVLYIVASTAELENSRRYRRASETRTRARNGSARRTIESSGRVPTGGTLRATVLWPRWLRQKGKSKGCARAQLRSYAPAARQVPPQTTSRPQSDQRGGGGGRGGHCGEGRRGVRWARGGPLARAPATCTPARWAAAPPATCTTAAPPAMHRHVHRPPPPPRWSLCGWVVGAAEVALAVAT